MYKCLLGGTIDRCNICCTGGGADSSEGISRKDAMETLSEMISSYDTSLNTFFLEGNVESEAADVLIGNIHAKKENELERIIKAVGKVAVKYSQWKEVESADETIQVRWVALILVWK